jgi:hypothetical protein
MLGHTGLLIAATKLGQMGERYLINKQTIEEFAVTMGPKQ